ncbi:HECT-type E3 ubiquitin transferase [Malassezia brasiliensis]|uniref:HECT-type E3 ubiquitin transferase n=1 Tax=Malassezia brasiliensis TaxID=1821822 RepID=A0AAF0DQL9_9BASI|nr:HECT-type E3 ubiquitin transferase [Malassezia brasiliensis]
MPSGGVWGRQPGVAPPAPPAGPSASAFPDLASAQRIPTTRRTRSAARAMWASDELGGVSPAPQTRTDQLNARATHWRRTGRVAREIVFRDENIVPIAPTSTTTLEDEERGASIASVRIHDKTQGAALGAWASLFQPRADPLVTDAPLARAHPAHTHARLRAADLTLHTVHDAAELAVCPAGGAVREARACGTRALRADAREGAADVRRAYDALFHLVETCVSSPVMLYRLCARGEVGGVALDALVHAADDLPLEVRDAFRVHLNACLDTHAAHLAAAQRAADPDEALAVFESRFDDVRVAPHVCALLALELCAPDDTERVARLAHAVPRQAWAAPSEVLGDWPTPRLERLAQRVSTAISARLGSYYAARQHARILPTATDVQLPSLLALLGHIWDANAARPVDARCDVAAFYAVATELGFALDEYQQWVHAPRTERGVHLLCDEPCVLSLGAKVQILAWEARQAMRQASTYAWLHTHAPIMPTSRAHAHVAAGIRVAAGEATAASAAGPADDDAALGVCTVHVRRTHIVDDSRPLLSLDATALLRPMKVTFDNELAQDAGGVLKEYLLLVCEALCAPSAGLFADIDEDPQRGVLWLVPWTPDADDTETHDALQRLELLGVVLGLALVHGVTLPLRFPGRLYAHLLHAANVAPPPPTDLAALRPIRPALATGLAQLLAYDERSGRSVEDAMHLTWSVAHGAHVYPLAPGAPVVTAADRDAYVTRVCTWVLHDAVRAPLDALTRGFVRVAAPPTPVARSPLCLLQPEELETLLRGRDERVLDVDALRASAAHVGFPARASRYGAQVHANVEHFWAVWASLDPASQHALLGFITGSPRVPAMGAASVGLRIQHVDDPYAQLGTARVPWSSTCTSTLFLPVYDSRAALEAKVRVALAHSTGFGLG